MARKNNRGRFTSTYLGTICRRGRKYDIYLRLGYQFAVCLQRTPPLSRPSALANSLDEIEAAIEAHLKLCESELRSRRDDPE